MKNKLNLKSETLKFSISGMRGLFPEDLNAGNLPHILHAYHTVLPAGPVAIARDARPTSEAIAQITRGVLMSLGRDVHSLGLVPTPTIKAYVNAEGLKGGIMVSASHNPVEYAAYKFIGRDGAFFSEKENTALREALNTEKYNWGRAKKQGRLRESQADAVKLHIDSVIRATGLEEAVSVKAALDPVGSCAAVIAAEYLKKLKVQYTGIHFEETGRFERGPEPVKKSLKKLSELTAETEADIGFAFDPDADRLALVQPDGVIPGEEYTLPLVMSEALKDRQGPVAVNLSSSWLNRSVAESMNSKIHLSEVGEANVVALMKKKKAVFGGEGNGGVIDPEIPSFGRDSIAGMGWLLRLLVREKISLTGLIASLPPVYMKKMTVPVKGALNSLFNRMQKAFSEFKTDSRDGLHLSDKGGLPWIHLRTSNTEPVVRLIIEAQSRKELSELEKIITEKVLR